MTRLGLSLPSTAVLRGRHQPSAATAPPPAGATALLARMAVAPAPERAAAIAALVSALQGAGIWQKLDALWIMAAHDAQAARLNWVPWTGTVTNMIRNNSMQGAAAGSPGTVPANWTAAFANGLARSIVDVGTEDGIDYVDIRYAGTATVATTIQFALFDGFTQVAAALGQVWTGSVYCVLSGGTLSGISSVALQFTERDGSGTLVSGGVGATTFTPVAGALRNNRIQLSRTLSGTSTTRLACGLVSGMSAGAVIDVTLRIGLPQQVQMDVPGDPIRTTGAAASELQTLSRFNLVAVNSPPFTIDRGYASNGTSSYLNTNLIPAGSAQYLQNDAHLSLWDLTDRAAISRYQMGAAAPGLINVIGTRVAGDQAYGRVNDGGGTVSNDRSDGFFVASRQSSSSRTMYRDGVSLGDVSVASAARQGAALFLLGTNNTGVPDLLSTDQLAAASVGAGLTADEVIAFHAALNAYLVSAGAVT